MSVADEGVVMQHLDLPGAALYRSLNSIVS